MELECHCLENPCFKQFLDKDEHLPRPLHFHIGLSKESQIRLIRDYLSVRAALAVTQVRLHDVQRIAEVGNISENLSVRFGDHSSAGIESRIRSCNAFVNIVVGKEEVDLLRFFAVNLQKEVFDLRVSICAEVDVKCCCFPMRWPWPPKPFEIEPKLIKSLLKSSVESI